MLVVGLLGLIFSIKGRSRGVSGLMVGAFAVMLLTTVASIAWQFVAANISSWAGELTADEIRLIFMGVGIPLELASLLSWLLVAIAVVKSGRQHLRPAAPQSGSFEYPMAAQPGFPPPRPGYVQPDPPAQQPPS